MIYYDSISNIHELAHGYNYLRFICMSKKWSQVEETETQRKRKKAVYIHNTDSSFVCR